LWITWLETPVIHRFPRVIHKIREKASRKGGLSPRKLLLLAAYLKGDGSNGVAV
jgi:hypothetical protein